MQQEVYADLLFLINFSMDYLCLYICAKVMHRKMRLTRMLLAASLGGIYSVISLFMNFSPAIELSIDCLVCLIMCAIVFGERGRSAGSIFLCSFLYIGISMMMGGCMTAIFNLLNRLDLPLESIEADGISTYLFAILAAISGLIALKSGQVISRRAPIKECVLKIRISDKEALFRGFADSGNLVRDPLSNRCVIFIDRETFSKTFDLSFFDRYAKGELSPDCPYKSMRLIPIKTAAGQSVVVAASADDVLAEFESKRGKKTLLHLDALISPTDIGTSAEEYTAIIPSEILKS